MRELTQDEVALVAGGATTQTVLQTAATGAMTGVVTGVLPAPRDIGSGMATGKRLLGK